MYLESEIIKAKLDAVYVWLILIVAVPIFSVILSIFIVTAQSYQNLGVIRKDLAPVISTESTFNEQTLERYIRNSSGGRPIWFLFAYAKPVEVIGISSETKDGSEKTTLSSLSKSESYYGKDISIMLRREIISGIGGHVMYVTKPLLTINSGTMLPVNEGNSNSGANKGIKLSSNETAPASGIQGDYRVGHEYQYSSDLGFTP